MAGLSIYSFWWHLVLSRNVPQRHGHGGRASTSHYPYTSSLLIQSFPLNLQLFHACTLHPVSVNYDGGPTHLHFRQEHQALKGIRCTDPFWKVISIQGMNREQISLCQAGGSQSLLFVSVRFDSHSSIYVCTLFVAVTSASKRKYISFCKELSRNPFKLYNSFVHLCTYVPPLTA